MLIYKITNLIDGKVYIGQTIKSLTNRWTGHCTTNNCRYLKSAIDKYGKENFTIEEIDGANSLSELNYLEQHYIYMHNSLAPNGYNLRFGGDNSPHNEETKKKIGEANSRRIWKEESKNKISKAHTGKQGPRKGQKIPESEVQKMREYRKGFTSEARILARRNNKTFDKKVLAVNMETNEHIEFKSAMEASRVLKIQASNITRVCNKKQNRSQAGGWKFSYV